jgi:hypothetical protein
MLGASIVHLSTILIFDFGNVPTVWYLFSFFGWHFITRHHFHLPFKYQTSLQSNHNQSLIRFCGVGVNSGFIERNEHENTNEINICDAVWNK